MDQANLYVDQIIDAIEALQNDQKQGRQVPHRNGYFKFSVGRHLIFFTRSDDRMNVIRVLHQSMDVERHL